MRRPKGITKQQWERAKKIAKAGLWHCEAAVMHKRGTPRRRIHTSWRVKVPGKPAPKVFVKDRKRALPCRVTHSLAVILAQKIKKRSR